MEEALVRKVTLPHVAGMPVHLHFLSKRVPNEEAPLAELPGERPLAVAFLLHGRLSESGALDATAAALVRRCAGVGDEKPKRNLVVVTLDHRNHGHRRDMFSVQYGTAQDVSLLISLLPAYLPATVRVELWACVGASLGGHSTWLALVHDPRITIGIPIIGCCDYLALMRNRLEGTLKKRRKRNEQGDGDEEVKKKGKVEEREEDYLPEGLKSAVMQLDVAGMGDRAVERLKGRKILVLCGGDDRLVPYHCSQPFIERLQRSMTGDGDGVCEVVVEEGKGPLHELTDSMVAAAGDFLWQWACVQRPSGHESRL